MEKRGFGHLPSVYKLGGGILNVRDYAEVAEVLPVSRTFI